MPTDASAREIRDAPSQASGVYVHVPFCRRKCRYCDFYSVADPSRMDDFVAALLREIALTPLPAQPADTLYFGGGTPSLVAPDALARIVDAAARRFALFLRSEITLEVNPGTVDKARLKAYGRAGVNRLNIGVQSFDDANLAFLGRIHTAGQALRTVAEAREAGFTNVGLDLIYGLPGQANADWEQDLKQAVAAGPEHLSCYMLTYEPGTPLGEDRRRGRVRPLADGRVCDLFEITRTFLADAGYEPYEISNFARSPGQHSRHNAKYWSLAPYAGLGPSAHSFCLPQRWWNLSDLTAYLAALAGGRLPVAGRESLSRDQLMIEAVYLGLRQTRGIDLEEFQARFGEDFRDLFAETAATLQTEGMVDVGASTLALTPAGRIYLDSIVGRLVDHVG